MSTNASSCCAPSSPSCCSDGSQPGSSIARAASRSAARTVHRLGLSRGACRARLSEGARRRGRPVCTSAAGGTQERQGPTPWVQRVRLSQTDLFDRLAARRYDLILSNPPYVRRRGDARTAARIPARTAVALAGAARDGLALVRRMLAQCRRPFAIRTACSGQIGHISRRPGRKPIRASSSSGSIPAPATNTCSCCAARIFHEDAQTGLLTLECLPSDAA